MREKKRLYSNRLEPKVRKKVSRYVLDLAVADDPDRHPVVLTPDEQEELRDGVRELRVLVRAAEGEVSPARRLLESIRAVAERAP